MRVCACFYLFYPEASSRRRQRATSVADFAGVFGGKKKLLKRWKKVKEWIKIALKKKNQWGYSPRHLKSELEKKQTVFPSSPVQTFLIGCRGWRCLCLPAPPPKPNPIDLGMTPHTPTNTHTHRPPPTNSSEPSDCFRVGFVEALARRRPFCEVPATDWCVYVCVCVCLLFCSTASWKWSSATDYISCCQARRNRTRSFRGQ